MTLEGSIMQLLCLIAGMYIFHLRTCSSVTIQTDGSIDNSTTFKCGNYATLICLIPGYRLGMTWSVDSDIIASCTLYSCVPGSPFKYGEVDFEFDRDNGIFKMMIPEIYYNVSGRRIKCEDGSTAADVTLTIKVLPDESTTKLIESNDNNTDTSIIKAIAECVHPSSEIYFVWYYYEANKTSKIYQSPANITEEPYNGECSGCETTRLSSKLHIPIVYTGKEYYLQIRITYNGTGDIDPIVINSTRTYLIKDDEDHHLTPENKNNSKVGIYVGVPIGCVLFVVFIAFVIFLIRRKLLNQ